MSTGQVREPAELLGAHGLAAALDGPDDFLELADELNDSTGRVCNELAATTPELLSLPLSWDDWRRCEEEGT